MKETFSISTPKKSIGGPKFLREKQKEGVKETRWVAPGGSPDFLVFKDPGYSTREIELYK